MKTKLKVYVLLLLAFAAVIAMSLASCTPQQRLNRLLKKHPDLIKHDTVFIDTTVTRAEVKKDTAKLVNKDVSKVDSIVYLLIHDTIIAKDLSSQIKNYIINRQCLLDTLRMDLANGGYVKVYQEGDQVKCEIFEPEEKTELSIPVTVNTVQPIKESWLESNYGWLLWIILVIAFIALLLSRRRQ